jgi:hypothetical protein
MGPRILTSALVVGERSTLCSGRFIAVERAPRYPLDRRLGGAQFRFRVYDEEKNVVSACPLKGSGLGLI